MYFQAEWLVGAIIFAIRSEGLEKARPFAALRVGLALPDKDLARKAIRSLAFWGASTVRQLVGLLDREDLGNQLVLLDELSRYKPLSEVATSLRHSALHFLGL